MIIEVESSIDTEIDIPYKTAGFKFINFIPSNNILCCLMPFYFYIEESKLTKEEISSLRERHRIITIRKAGKKLWRFIPNGESTKPVSNL